MFEFVRNNRRFIQLFLGLIGLPFMLWGVDSYVTGGDTTQEAAKVGDIKVSLREFEQSLNEQKERMRPALGSADPATLDNPQIRRSVLDGLVSRSLIDAEAKSAHLTVSDAQLAQYIVSIPSLQEGGKFSPQLYDSLVAQQGMSKEMFESRVRHDLTVQQAMKAVNGATLPGRAAADRWIAAQLDEREIAEFALKPDAYSSAVKLAPDAAKNYFEANRKQFELPERVRVEYLTLNADALATQTQPSDEAVASFYKEHAAEFKTPEQRRASHILINAAKDAPAAEDKAARAKAESLLAQLKKNPAAFAEVAKKESQDTGSAAQGGDLNWFGRGAMVPPFEKAVFELKENQISDIVRTDFGYHLIKLTGLRPEAVKPLAQVKDEVIARIKREAAAKKFAELTEGFTNTVYEQPDSLKPAAEKYKLTIQKSPWLIHGEKPGAAPFNHPKLLAALFSSDAIKNGRNTEAIEVAPGTLVSAHVVEHQASTVQTFEAVKTQIEKKLIQDEAVKLAIKEGEAKLAQLQKGEALNLAWSAPRTLMRAQAAMPPEAVRAVFSADRAKLPAFAGSAHPQGYVLYRITRDKPYIAADKESDIARALRTRYQRMISEQETVSWLAALRERHPVTENKAVLEKGGGSKGGAAEY